MTSVGIRRRAVITLDTVALGSLGGTQNVSASEYRDVAGTHSYSAICNTPERHVSGQDDAHNIPVGTVNIMRAQTSAITAVKETT